MTKAEELYEMITDAYRQTDGEIFQDVVSDWDIPCDVLFEFRDETKKVLKKLQYWLRMQRVNGTEDKPDYLLFYRILKVSKDNPHYAFLLQFESSMREMAKLAKRGEELLREYQTTGKVDSAASGLG